MISQYDETEYNAYEESLKAYRDLKNSIDTAFDDGKDEGKIEGKIEQKFETAKILKNSNVPIEVILKSTGLSESEIENL